MRAGARPQPREPDDYEPGSVRTGWQHGAASRVEEISREDLFTRVGEDAKALARSQGARRWPRSVDMPNVSSHEVGTPSVPRCSPASSPLASSSPCAKLPVWLATRPLWPPPCSVRAQGSPRHYGMGVGECIGQDLPGGGRVATNVMVRDLDLALPHVVDGRRLEVVVDGLPLFGRERSWPWTPLSCAETGRPGEERPLWMGLLWRQPAGGKR